MNLGDGDWHKSVPRSPAGNSSFRRKLLDRCLSDGGFRSEVLEVCRRDILFFVNAFAWTYNPRTRAKKLPFATWPFQDEGFLAVAQAIERGHDVVIEKSRDMGASWIMLTTFFWFWCFFPNYSFLMLSRKEELVDKDGWPDALFWKVDLLLDNLPSWMAPRFERKKLQLVNRENGSIVVGESTNSAAGVGGRHTAILVDEFSRMPEGYQILAGTADTTDCRLFNFTPWGTSNAAYKMASRTDVKKLRFHWSAHPEKAAGLYRFNEETQQVDVLDKTYRFPEDFQFVRDGKLRSPWYDAECVRRDNPREVAQMLDIDYQGSSYQFFDKTTIVGLQREVAYPPLWEGDVSIDKDTARPTGLVKAEGGPLKLWVNPDKNGRPPKAAYAAGADLSTGSGATNSCVSFVDARTGEKVASYETPFVVPLDLAPIAVALCRLFEDASGEPALFAWEMQGPGVQFGRKVIGLGYRRVYYRTTEDSLAKKQSDTAGWYPSPENRRVLLADYREALAKRRFLNRSTEALEECLAFVVRPNGNVEHAGVPSSFDPETGAADPTGAGVNHGDRVIADALAWKMALALGVERVTAETPDPDEPPTLSLAWRRQFADRQRQREDKWAV